MENDVISFSFSWKAMQLLGKSLYSNAWSAVSELVANGLDAGADTVSVLIDTADKANSTIEIMDDGVGMDREGLAVYTKVGYDRRANDSGETAVPPDEVMGRKGIGKLAALYLTENYYIQTRHEGETSTWQINRGDQHLDDTPSLRRVQNNSCVPLSPEWKGLSSGTIIVMKKVDLRGIGEAGFHALSSRLANQFLTSSMPGKKIMLCVRKDKKDPIEFKPVEKMLHSRTSLSWHLTSIRKKISLPISRK